MKQYNELITWFCRTQRVLSNTLYYQKRNWWVWFLIKFCSYNIILLINIYSCPLLISSSAVESQHYQLPVAMKDQGYIFCDCNMKTPSPSSSHICKLMFILILFLSLPYIFYSLSFLSSSLNLPTQNNNPFRVVSHHSASGNSPSVAQNLEKTTLKHVVFGIGASAKLWDRRKNYIKLWWRPHEMRGFVWLDKPVETDASDDCLLPPRKISGDTSRFEYRNSDGHRSALRISRIVSETLRLGNMEGVRWFVMGDDDTVFVPDNLISVLSKYDHNQFYYIGSSSESHLQNINFSYGMAYGGGGFAISYPLAKALEKMQDRCMQRYPKLYGSDDRIHACMTELGVPLTKQPGFHQVFNRFF